MHTMLLSDASTHTHTHMHTYTHVHTTFGCMGYLLYKQRFFQEGGAKLLYLNVIVFKC